MLFVYSTIIVYLDFNSIIKLLICKCEVFYYFSLNIENKIIVKGLFLFYVIISHLSQVLKVLIIFLLILIMNK